MTPLKFRLECEACGLGFIVTYDADVPTKLLSLQCRCGHTTPISQHPALPTPKVVDGTMSNDHSGNIVMD